MDFPDGHKAKVLEDGQCAICTNCERIKAEYLDQIANVKNKELVDELGDLEKRIEAKNKANEPPDPVDVKRQKEIHDTFETHKKTQAKWNDAETDLIKNPEVIDASYADYVKSKKAKGKKIFC